MGAAHEALAAQQARVAQILEQEEAQFARTLAQGMTVLEGELATLAGKEIPGDVVFKLYDTYGFPVDLTADIARERDLTLDEAGFEAAMADQRARARSASRFAAATEAELEVAGQVEFRGYEVPRAEGTVTGLFRRTEAGLEPVEALEAGASGAVVLDQTPFYAESGGQIGDQGELRSSAAVFAVEDTRKAGAQHLHLGTLGRGSLALGDRLEAHIDAARRQAIALNHSATHLLHAALREVLGQHVEQRGSLVTAERLRFDFAHHDAIDRATLDQIEDRVNAVIWSNSPVQTRVMSFDAARDAGAMALFGEKYGDEVRVLSMAGDFSVELCGGTHVAQTGDIGLLRIVSEQGIASGVRRIEAVTGPAAHAYLRDADVALRSAAGRLKVSREQVLERMEGLLTQQKALERKIDELEQRLAQEAGADLAAGAVEVGGLRVLAATLPSGGAKALLPALDQLKARLAPAAVVLAAVEEGTVSLAAGVSADWAKRLPAGPLVQHVGAQVGAKGGGRPELARAGGGNQPEALEAALASVAAYVAERLS
jgi:alanyl-tRNA synthetase